MTFNTSYGIDVIPGQYRVEVIHQVDEENRSQTHHLDLN